MFGFGTVALKNLYLPVLGIGKCYGFKGPKHITYYFRVGISRFRVKLCFNITHVLNCAPPQNHEPHNGAGSHHESEPVPAPEPAAEAPAPLKRPLEQEAEEEVEEQQEAKRVRESEVQGDGDHEQDQVHHGEQQQQPVVPSPQLPIHTGGD